MPMRLLIIILALFTFLPAPISSEGLVYDKSHLHVVPSYDPVLKQATRCMAVSEEYARSFEVYTLNQTTPGYKEWHCGNFLDQNGELQVRRFFRLSAGPPIETGRNLDCMIEGKPFFTIQGPWGIGYTRDGRFDLDIHGRLVTFADHFLVLGQNGPISIGSRSNLVISEKGEVFVNDEYMDTLKVTECSDPSQLDSFNAVIFFSMVEDAKFKVNDNPIYAIRQGYYEGSSVTKGHFGEVARYRYPYYGSSFLIQRTLRAYQSAISMANP